MKALVITDQASLRVALSLMTGDWDVVIASNLEEAAMAPGPFNATIVDLGTTEDGLAALSSFDETKSSLPSLLIGDEERPPDGKHRFMSRPFSIDKLVIEVEQAVHGSNAWGNLGPKVEAPRPRQSPISGGPAGTSPKSPMPEQMSETRAFARAEDKPPRNIALEDLRPRRPRFGQAPKQDTKPKRSAKGSMEARSKTLVERLTKAVAVLNEIESLISEYPIVSNWREMSQAFLDEVLELFSPETASLLIQGDDGKLYPVVSFGLSMAESAMKVPADHSLIKEVAGNLRSILIVPVHLAHGMVAGIGGAHTEAFMVSPLAVEGVCYGVCAVGSSDFDEGDLRRLEALSAEAAPGLALGLLLERSRSRMLAINPV